MTINSPRNYYNLIRHIKNWEIYFFNKYKKDNSRVTLFRTRKNHLEFNVPEKLYGAFKEVFLRDHYDINYLANTLPQKPVIVDIGANAGYFSILMLMKFPGAKLFCFEPIPANHKVLVKNLSNNLGLSELVNIYDRSVVGKNVDKLSMYYTAKDSFSISASRFENFDHNIDHISVKTITLEELINSVKAKVDLLKLDCEGGEYDIIYEISIGTFKDVKQIVMEVHDLDKQKNDINGLNDYLTSLDFKTRHHPIDKDSHVLHAWRNS